MKIKQVLLLMLVFLCGCVHHGEDRLSIPSAVPEKRITKTAVPEGAAVPEPDASADDPWERCAAEINSGPILIKAADLKPEEFSRRVRITFMIQDADAETSFIVSRCMNGKVYACRVLESTNCLELLDFSAEPDDRMNEVCSDPSLEGGMLTSRITGRNSAYQWICHDGKAVITEQIAEADAAGYDRSIWPEIPAPQ